MQVTISCITSSYGSVNATLQLQKSWIRKGPTLTTDPEEFDLRADTSVIVTSSGKEDAGTFLPSVQDERYSHFEGAGAISQWLLSLPMDFPQFDYRTISDVILHVRYTALPGASIPTADNVRKQLDGLTPDSTHTGLYQLFSARHDFPQDWYRYTTAPLGTKLTLNVTRAHLPFALQKAAKGAVTGSVTFWAPTGSPSSTATSSAVAIAGPDSGPWTVTIDQLAGGGAQDDAYVFFKYTVS